MKVKVWINTGFAGARHEEILELPDDFTEQQINEEALEWTHQKIEYNWEILP